MAITFYLSLLVTIVCVCLFIYLSVCSPKSSLSYINSSPKQAIDQKKNNIVDYHHDKVLLDNDQPANPKTNEWMMKANECKTKNKKRSSATGNRTRISVVTGRNTNHYTIADSGCCLFCWRWLIMIYVKGWVYMDICLTEWHGVLTNLW